MNRAEAKQGIENRDAGNAEMLLLAGIVNGIFTDISQRLPGHPGGLVVGYIVAPNSLVPNALSSQVGFKS